MILRLAEFGMLKFDLVKAVPPGQPSSCALHHHVYLLELKLPARVRRQDAGTAGDGQPLDALWSVPFAPRLRPDRFVTEPIRSCCFRIHRGRSLSRARDRRPCDPAKPGSPRCRGVEIARPQKDGPSDECRWTTPSTRSERRRAQAAAAKGLGGKQEESESHPGGC